MSNTPNLRSTEDDPDDAFWKSFAPVLFGRLPAAGGTSYARVPSDPIIWSRIGEQLSAVRISDWDTLKSAPITFTADSGTVLVVENSTSDVVRINVPDSSNVPNLSRLVGQPTNRDVEVGLTGSAIHVAAGSLKHEKEASWVEHLSWFIPKEIREPWLGDLLEDRERMSSKGYNQARIEWATWIQLLLLFANRLWAKFGWGLLIYNRVSEWFSANK